MIDENDPYYTALKDEAYLKVINNDMYCKLMRFAVRDKVTQDVINLFLKESVEHKELPTLYEQEKDLSNWRLTVLTTNPNVKNIMSDYQYDLPNNNEPIDQPTRMKAMGGLRKLLFENGKYFPYFHFETIEPVETIESE